MVRGCSRAEEQGTTPELWLTGLTVIITLYIYISSFLILHNMLRVILFKFQSVSLFFFQSVSLNEVLTPYEVLKIFSKSNGTLYIFRNLSFKSLNLHNYSFKILNK